MKHSMLKCLSLVLALATIAGVFAVPAFAVVNTCNHYAYEENWTYIGTKDPTCTEFGGKVYQCPECDKQFVDSRDWDKNEFKPLGHDWKEVDRQDATLEEPGWIEYECERCPVKDTETLDPTKCANNGCDFDIVDTATCTAAGKVTKTCKNCGYKVEEESPAKGHTWDDGEIVKAPLCGVDENGDPNYGTIKFSCTVAGCNGTRVDNEVLPAQGSHKWEWVEAKAVSCGVAGNTAGYKCVYCTAAHPTEPMQVLQAPPHDWVAKEDDTHKNVALGCVDEVIWEQCSICLTWRDASDRTATGVGGNHYISLHENGYVVLDTTMRKVSDATCEAAAVYACKTCTFATSVGTKKPHNFDASLKREPTCQQYGAYVCGDCGAVAGYKDLEGNVINPELNKKPHEADANGKTVVAPGCTLEGYTTYVCKWCHETIKDTYTNPVGHTRNETTEQAADCLNGGHTAGWVCAKGDDCDAKNEWEPSTPTNALGHDWLLTPNLPANCMYGIHTNEVCTRCGIENAAKVPTYDDRNKDLTKHQWDPTKTLKTEPTCEKPGSIREYCALCFVENENEITATHHSFEIVENGQVVGLKNPVGRVPAVCGQAGYDVYYCTNENCDIAYGTGKFYEKGAVHTVNNGTADVQVTFIFDGAYALDIKLQDRYNSHYAYVNFSYNPFADAPAFTTNFTGVTHDSDGKTGREVREVGYVITTVNGVVTGSCAQASYYEYTCTTCEYDYNKLRSDDYGLTGQHVAGDPQDKQATCDQGGYTGKVVCERCAATLIEGTPTYAAHNYDKANISYPYEENKAPTCEGFGFAKGGWCLTCNAYVTEGQIAPLGHKADTLTPAQKADCEKEGWDAHYNCANAGCDYVFDNAKMYDANGDLLTGDALTAAYKNVANWMPSIRTAGANGYVNGYAVKLGHHVVYEGTVDYACLVDGYDYFECDRAGCDYVEVKNNFHFGFANHRYTDESKLVLNADGEYVECADSYLCCANEIPAANGMAACGDKKLVHEAGKHVNLNGVVIKGQDGCQFWLECQAAEADKATCVVNRRHTCHVCQYCDVEFTFAKIHEFLGNYTTNSHEADCQNYAHDVNTCNECGHIWIANVDAVNGYGDHRPVAIPGTKVEASFAAPGTEDYKCSLCGHTWTETTAALEGIEFEIDIANKNEGQEILDGSVIAVAIKLNGYQFGLTSLISKLAYNKDLFTYIGFEAENAFGVSNSADQAGKTTVANAANGVVTILSVSEDYANGGLQNVEITGTQTYITLYFRVACGAYASTADQTFALTEITATQAVNGNADTPVDAALIHNNDVEDLAGEIFQLGNINADAFIGQEDIIALRSLLLVEGYEAVVAGAGDVNQDGDINLVDFALLQQVIIGALTYEQLVAAVA